MPNRVVGDIFTDLAIKGKGGVERILYKVTFLFVLSLFRCRYLSQRMRNGNAFIDDLEVTRMGGWGVLIMVCINFDFSMGSLQSLCTRKRHCECIQCENSSIKQYVNHQSGPTTQL